MRMIQFILHCIYYIIINHVSTFFDDLLQKLNISYVLEQSVLSNNMKGDRRQSECIFDKMQFVISMAKQTTHVWFRVILSLIWCYNYLHHSHEKMFLIRIATQEYRSTRCIFWWTNETSFYKNFYNICIGMFGLHSKNR